MKNKKLLTGMLIMVLSISVVCSNVSVVLAEETKTEMTQANEGIAETEGLTKSEESIAETEELTELEKVIEETEEPADFSAENETQDQVTDENVTEMVETQTEIKETQTSDVVEEPTQSSESNSEETNDTVIKNDETGIPDKNFYDDILREVDTNKDGILTVSEAEAITFLSVYIADYENLKGIEYFKFLEGLALSGELDYGAHTVFDICDLQNANLSSLSYVFLEYIDTDISPLINLPSLTNLRIENCEISDIRVLENLTNLESLTLFAANICDISILENLTKLERLDLCDNDIYDISALANLTSLGALDLCDNDICDVSALTNLTFLYHLDLSRNNIRDVSALANLISLGCDIRTDGNPIGTSLVYNPSEFADTLAKEEIVIPVNNYVTITFAQGSKVDNASGKTEYDFTTTVTTEFANANLPAFVTKTSFISKISYAYSGELPAEATIKIFVGTDYEGKTVFYFEDKDGTYGDVKEATVENGYITVTQNHCSDYIITAEHPEALYAEYEEQKNADEDNKIENQPSGDNKQDSDKKDNPSSRNNNQNSQNSNNAQNSNSVNNNTTSGNKQNDNHTQSPKLGDTSSMGVLSILMMSISAMIVFGKKKYKDIF